MDSDPGPPPDGVLGERRPSQRRASILLRRSNLQRTQTKDLLQLCVEHESDKYAQEKSKLVNRTSGFRRDNDVDVACDVRTSAIRLEGENSDAEYDTDLETEHKQEQIPDDVWGKAKYVKSCRKMGLNPVGSVLRGLRTHRIQVRGRGLNERDALPISFALLDNSLVTSLVLEENRLGNKGAEYMALMLYENDTIKRLNLAYNTISSLGVRSILEMLLENQTITTLDLSGNHLTDTDAFMFAEYIEETSTLEYLMLNNNDFGDEAGLVLGPALALNESIRSVDLSWNKIRKIGGIAICHGVEANAVIKKLNLAYNGLSNDGAAAMAECLKVNDILIDVDLTCNRIFDEGAAFLSKALSINETLKYLRISNNPMTTLSAVTLLEAIKTNNCNSLEYVDITSIHVYKNVLELLSEVREHRPSFRLQYGGVVNSEGKFGGVQDGFSNKNPLSILRDYIAAENLRLVDLFKRFDKDGGGSISRKEFIGGLKSIKVPLTEHQLDRLITMLDRDGDGEVDYGELVQGEKEHRRMIMKLKQEAIVRMAQKGNKDEPGSDGKIPSEHRSRPKLLTKRSAQPK